jgi:hypothetical protein
MLTWEQYDDVTWGVEWGPHLALIKAQDEKYTCIVGTVTEAIFVLHELELSTAKSRCSRALIALHNEADLDKVTI